MAAGKRVRVKFVDADDNPIPNVNVVIKRWRNKSTLFNTATRKIPDNKIPRLSDDQGIFAWGLVAR